jgi:hypothetical protein
VLAMFRTLFTVLSASLLALAPPAVADEHGVLKDPSFEQRLEADAGGWRMFGPSRFSDDQSREGSASMFNGGASKSVAYHPYFVGTVSGSYQEFPATPGSRWRLTGYGMAATALQGTPAFGIIQISFFDADGQDLGAVETVGASSRAKLSNEVNGQSAVGEWVALDTGVATAPEGTATVQAFTLYVDYSGAKIFQGVYFDDLHLQQLTATE